MKIRSKDIAEQFDVGTATWKRRAKLFLGDAPVKGKTPAARNWDALSAARVFLGGLLLDLGMRDSQAVEILPELYDWCSLQGYFDRRRALGPFEHDPAEVKTWSARFDETHEGQVVCVLKATIDDEFVAKRAGRIIHRETYFYEALGAEYDFSDRRRTFGKVSLDAEFRFFWITWLTDIKKEISPSKPVDETNSFNERSR